MTGTINIHILLHTSQPPLLAAKVMCTPILPMVVTLKGALEMMESQDESRVHIPDSHG